MTVIPKPSSPNSQAKVPPCPARTSKVKPSGCRGKNHPRPEGLRYFSRNLACTGHDLLWPVVTGTPAPKSRTNKKI